MNRHDHDLRYRLKNKKRLAASWRQYYERNKERISERQRIWRRKHLNEQRDRDRRYYFAHKKHDPNYQSKSKQYQRAYYLKQKATLVKRAKQWRLTHPEQYKLLYNNYRSLNRDRILELKRKAYIRNRERIRSKTKVYQQLHAERYRIANKTYAARSRLLLTDHYVRTVLCQNSQLSTRDFPPELVEVKRIHLMMRRELKQHRRNTYGESTGPISTA